MKIGLQQIMDDREYLPLSWLSQLAYCPRRAGLLLNERLWAESTDTAKGRAEHTRVHTQRVEKRGNLVNLYEFTVFSDSLLLLGKCDCVEARRDDSGCRIPAVDFPVSLYPVEYKHGTLREEETYQIQLCAQAMCMEEMFHTVISEGALFFTSSHRRMTIPLSETLRTRTVTLAKELHLLRDTLSVPSAKYSAKCCRCSLQELCMPKIKMSAESYLLRLRQSRNQPDVHSGKWTLHGQTSRPSERKCSPSQAAVCLHGGCGFRAENRAVHFAGKVAKQ